MLSTIAAVALPLLIAIAGLAYVIGDQALGRNLVILAIALVVIIPLVLELWCLVARLVHDHADTVLGVIAVLLGLAVLARVAALPPSPSSRKKRIQRRE